MMSTECQAKDPQTCRVHGSNGQLRQLQIQVNDAVVAKDKNKYLEAKQLMETLSDDPEMDILVDHLRSSNKGVAAVAEEMMKEHGSTESQILVKKHFIEDDTELIRWPATSCYMDIQKRYGVTFRKQFTQEAFNQLEESHDTEKFVENLLVEAKKLKKRHNMQIV
jgi:hypothetical protein